MLSQIINNESKAFKKIKLNEIFKNPAQPRKFFDTDSLLELSNSIKIYGVLNPISVRKISRGYELIAGERRLRASRLAGLEYIPCIIFDANDEKSSAIAIVENIQRKDLDFFEEAMAYKKLINVFALTQEQTAVKVGKTQSSIANKLRLLKLSDEVISIIRQANLTERHARCLLKLEDNDIQINVLNYIIKHDLNVAKSEKLIEKVLSKKDSCKKGSMKILFKDIKLFINTVEDAVKIMKQAGFNAIIEKEDLGESINFKISIPTARG